MTLQDRSIWPALGAFIAPQIGAAAVTITSAVRLPGGAVQENWRLEADVEGGPTPGARVWVLRTQAAARLPVSLDANSEAQVLKVAYAAGVPVAAPLAEGGSDGPLGRSFAVQPFIEGNAQGRRIARDPELASYGAILAADLAATLARIHTIAPAAGQATPGQVLTCLPVPMQSPARAEVARFRAVLTKAGDQRPALEYVLSWLDANAPPARPLALVHGDYRTGNYLVHKGRLSGILDWEFAHWGDPDEDLGWFTARCWRFGNDHLPAGGIAPLDGFLAAYVAASGRTVTADQLRFWQIMAAAKWATIAVLQGDRLRLGGEQKLELALTGLMPAEMEHEALSEILVWSRENGGKGGPKWL